MNYDELLKRARGLLPEIVTMRDRFEIPLVKGHIQGNKTVITNFPKISSTLRRDQAHILKYLLKELATPGEMNGTFLTFKRKLSSSIINQKVRQYTNIFVLCPECGKPDTKIITEKSIFFLKCQACGAKTHIKY
jgi:translation initiation factor 2 subunit 2